MRTIRFYADSGIVPAPGRTAVGYRLYNGESVARLEAARTLRSLGLDLSAVKQILDREVTLSDVVVLRANALDTAIRILRLQPAVLRAVAKRNTTLEEIELMHKLAKLSEEERNRILSEYYDEVFGGLDIDPEFEQRLRSATADLPDEPAPEQLEAWIELAELVQDPSFRQRVRQMAEAHSATRQAGEEVLPEAAKGIETVVLEHVGPAVAGGVDPASREARAVLIPIADAWRGQQADTPELRTAMADRFALGTDRRVERYWQLLGVTNGWPSFPAMTPAFEWTIDALRAQPRREE